MISSINEQLLRRTAWQTGKCSVEVITVRSGLRGEIGPLLVPVHFYEFSMRQISSNKYRMSKLYELCIFLEMLIVA